MDVFFYGPENDSQVYQHVEVQGTEVKVLFFLEELHRNDEPESVKTLEDFVVASSGRLRGVGYPYIPSTTSYLVKGEKLFKFLGTLSLDLAHDKLGLDEVVDFSVLDFRLDANYVPHSVVNRFSETAPTKTLTKTRNGAAKNVRCFTSLMLPVAAKGLEGATLVLTYGRNRPTGVVPDVAICNTTEYLDTMDHFFKCEPVHTQFVEAGELVEVEFDVKWNRRADLVLDPITFKVESNAGYLPVRQVTSKDGKLKVKVRALDLVPGDVIKLKVNCNHVSRVGITEITVV